MGEFQVSNLFLLCANPSYIKTDKISYFSFEPIFFCLLCQMNEARIHFLDNSSKVFLVNPKTSIKDLLAQCLSKFHILESDVVLPYFGLFESRNGGSIDGVLNLETVVQDVLQSWTEAGVDKTAKFLFMIRLQVPSLWGLTYKDVIASQMHIDESSLLIKDYLKQAEVIDSSVLHLQFIQAVYNVITGRYPVTNEEALALGSIHFILKFGVFRPESHKPGFLGNRIVEFIPIKLLKTTGFEDWEKKLLLSVEQLSKEEVRVEIDGEEGSSGPVLFIDPDSEKLLSAEHKYMLHIYSLKNIAGSTFFRCTQKCTRNLPESVYLGIQPEGIDILDKQKKLLRSFSIEDIFRWGFKPNTMFYFEVNADNELGTGSLEFETNEGKVVSDLMTDYAMAFLKERERAEVRMANTLPPPPAPPSATRNGVPPPPSGKKAPKTANDKNRAATKIQALYRGFALRNEWIKEDASILIQSIWRGYKARCLLSSMIEQMIKDGQL